MIASAEVPARGPGRLTTPITTALRLPTRIRRIACQKLRPTLTISAPAMIVKTLDEVETQIQKTSRGRAVRSSGGTKSMPRVSMSNAPSSTGGGEGAVGAGSAIRSPLRLDLPHIPDGRTGRRRTGVQRRGRMDERPPRPVSASGTAARRASPGPRRPGRRAPAHGHLAAGLAVRPARARSRSGARRSGPTRGCWRGRRRGPRAAAASGTTARGRASGDGSPSRSCAACSARQSHSIPSRRSPPPRRRLVRERRLADEVALLRGRPAGRAPARTASRCASSPATTRAAAVLARARVVVADDQQARLDAREVERERARRHDPVRRAGGGDRVPQRGRVLGGDPQLVADLAREALAQHSIATSPTCACATPRERQSAPVLARRRLPARPAPAGPAA